MGDPSDFTTDTNCCVKNATSENVYLTMLKEKYISRDVQEILPNSTFITTLMVFF